MSGDDFLKLAGLLFAPYQTRAKSATEALSRTIINRSYYGAHHLAVAFLESLGFPVSSLRHRITSLWPRATLRPRGRVVFWPIFMRHVPMLITS